MILLLVILIGIFTLTMIGLTIFYFVYTMKRVTELKDKDNALIKTMDERDSKLESEVTDVNKELIKTDTEIKTIFQAVDKTNKDVVAMRKDVDRTKKDVAGVGHDVTNIKKGMVEMGKDVEQIQGFAMEFSQFEKKTQQNYASLMDAHTHFSGEIDTIITEQEETDSKLKKLMTQTMTSSMFMTEQEEVNKDLYRRLEEREISQATQLSEDIQVILANQDSKLNILTSHAAASDMFIIGQEEVNKDIYRRLEAVGVLPTPTTEEAPITQTTITDNFKTSRICIDDVCFNGTQLKGLLPSMIPNDLDKRANLLAVAFYNGLRDPTRYDIRLPNDNQYSIQGDIYDDKIWYHMMLVGCWSGTLGLIIKANPDMYYRMRKGANDLEKQGKYWNNDLVAYFVNFLRTEKPENNNPNSLTLFELEMEVDRGELKNTSDIALTFASLDPSGIWFAPDTQFVSQETRDQFKSSLEIVDIITQIPRIRELMDKAIFVSYTMRGMMPPAHLSIPKQ